LVLEGETQPPQPHEGRAAINHGRIVAVVPDGDAADRFLWLALLDSLKAMASICQVSLQLTFAHAKDALLTYRSFFSGHARSAFAATVVGVRLMR